MTKENSNIICYKINKFINEKQFINNILKTSYRMINNKKSLAILDPESHKSSLNINKTRQVLHNMYEIIRSFER